ncbi:MAG: hypothetical protein ABH840_02945 [Nanoarchaeota archaeon]
MDLSHNREEKKVVKRLADWCEYHFLGIPIGIIKDTKEHGLGRAVEHYCNLRSFVKSKLARDYRKMWVGKRREHLRDVRDGEESGYYRYQNPVDFELRRRDAHRAASRPLEIHSRWMKD